MGRKRSTQIRKKNWSVTLILTNMCHGGLLTLLLIWMLSWVSPRALASSSMIMCTWMIYCNLTNILLNFLFESQTNLVPSAMSSRWYKSEHLLLRKNCLSPVVALKPAVLSVHLNKFGLIQLACNLLWSRAAQLHSRLKKQSQVWI